MSRWQRAAIRLVPCVTLILGVCALPLVRTSASGRTAHAKQVGSNATSGERTRPMAQAIHVSHDAKSESNDRPIVSSASTPPPQPPNPTRLSDAELTAIESLAETILRRRDAASDAELRLADADDAFERAMAAHQDSRKRVEAARAALKLYLEETYPQARDNAKSELTRAQLNQKITYDRSVWAKDMLRKGYFSGELTEREGQIADQAKIEAENARKNLESIENTLYPQDRRELQAVIDSADGELKRNAAAWEKARAVRVAAEVLAQELRLTPKESLAIIRMDDALKLAESGSAIDARMAFDDAKLLWEADEHHRAAVRTASLHRRIGHAAKYLREHASAPHADGITRSQSMETVRKLAPAKESDGKN